MDFLLIVLAVSLWFGFAIGLIRVLDWIEDRFGSHVSTSIAVIILILGTSGVIYEVLNDDQQNDEQAEQACECSQETTNRFQGLSDE